MIVHDRRRSAALDVRYNIINVADLDAAVVKRFNGTVEAQTAAPAADVDSLTSSPSKS